MARFTGTVQEFHHLIGPRIRNAVNIACKSYRDRLGGICQECGEKAELQSAHVHERDRRTLIEAVLKDHTDETGVVKCDLATAERRIIERTTRSRRRFAFFASHAIPHTTRAAVQPICEATNSSSEVPPPISTS